MVQKKSPYPTDLPPWLLALARQIARDCAHPGTYTITLDVPHHKRAPRIIQIDKTESIRRMKI